MNTKRVILLGLLVMGVAAPSYAAESGVAAASYAAESAPQAPLEISAAHTGIAKFLTGQGGATTGSLTAQDAAATMWQGVCDWICPSAYAADKGAAPVAYWRFDEGGGPTAYDESANNNDGTLTPGTLGTNTAAGQMWTRQGKIGGALECDGTDDYVDISDTDSIDFAVGAAFTLEAWVKPNSLHNGAVITKGAAGIHFNYQFGIRSSGQIWITNTGAEYSTTLTPVVAQTWQHIVSVWNNGTVSIYHNGSFVQNLSCNNSGGNTLALRIGNRGGTEYFSGLIDDVRIYNYARTAAQILVDYNAGSAAHLGAGTDPNEGNPPILYFNFDENAGTTVYDRSGNNNSASTFVGTPSWVAGKYGSCLKFPMDNDYIYASPSSTINLGASDFSVVSWVNVPKPVTYGSGICGRYPHNTSYNGCFVVGILDDTASLFFFHRNTSGVAESYGYDYSLYFSKWVHMAWVKSGTKLYLYLNGELKQTWTPTISFNVTFVGWNYMISNTGWSPGDMNGLMVDEHKVYNYARSAAQITYDYNKSKPVAHYKFDEGGGAIAHNEYSTADTGSSPVGWWRMDAASSGSANGATITDATGNGNNGTATYGANLTGMSWTAGKIGPGALDFDGADDYVNCGTGASLNITDTITMEVWATRRNATHWGYLIGKGVFRNGAATRNYGIRYGPSGYGINVRIGTDVSPYEYNIYYGNYDTNVWQHIVATIDTNGGTNGVMKLFLNGVQVATTNFNGNILLDGSSVNMGVDETGNNPLNGLIDDVRIYNYARTAEQIYNDYKTDHGTLVGDTKFVDGKIGKALQFDGTGDYVYIGNLATGTFDLGTGDFTISYWVKTSGSSYTSHMGKQNSGRTTGWGIRTSGAGRFDMDIDGGTYISTNANEFGSNMANVDDGNWHHVAIRRSNGSVTGYKDGVASNTFTQTTNLTTSDLFYIGRSGDNYMNGLIDDVRIYNYARTAEQVMQDYNAGVASRLGAQSAGEADPWAGALPVGHWKLDENTGVLAYDAGGNGNNGTLGGGTAAYQPTWTQGKFGPCLTFDGNDDRVDCGTNSSLSFGTGNFSISLWMKATGTDSYNAVFDKGAPANASSPGYQLFLSGGSLRYNISDGGGINWTELVVGGTPDMRDNTWHHVVWVYNGSYNKFYLDGRLLDSDAWTYGSGNPTASFLIGKSWVNSFRGCLDDFRVYNYALTQAQVAWLYNRGKPVGHWRMDEGSGTTAYDESDNNNDGTITIGATGTQTTVAAAWTNGATGKFGKCMSFDGTDDLVSCGNGSSLNFAEGNEWTVSSWIKTSASYTGINGGKKPVLKGTGGAIAGYAVAIGQLNSAGYDNKVGFVIDKSPGNNYVASTNSLPLVNDGNWHHVAIVFDAKNNVKVGGTIYFDGASYGYVNSVVDKAGWSADSSQALKIGGQPGEFFTGLIDDVRIYNYARTTSQIMEDYNQGMAVKLGD